MRSNEIVISFSPEDLAEIRRLSDAVEQLVKHLEREANPLHTTYDEAFGHAHTLVTERPRLHCIHCAYVHPADEEAKR